MATQSRSGPTRPLRSNHTVFKQPLLDSKPQKMIPRSYNNHNNHHSNHNNRIHLQNTHYTNNSNHQPILNGPHQSYGGSSSNSMHAPVGQVSHTQHNQHHRHYRGNFPKSHCADLLVIIDFSGNRMIEANVPSGVSHLGKQGVPLHQASKSSSDTVTLEDPKRAAVDNNPNDESVVKMNMSENRLKRESSSSSSSVKNNTNVLTSQKTKIPSTSNLTVEESQSASEATESTNSSSTSRTNHTNVLLSQIKSSTNITRPLFSPSSSGIFDCDLGNTSSTSQSPTPMVKSLSSQVLSQTQSSIIASPKKTTIACNTDNIRSPSSTTQISERNNSDNEMNDSQNVQSVQNQNVNKNSTTSSNIVHQIQPQDTNDITSQLNVNVNIGKKDRELNSKQDFSTPILAEKVTWTYYWLDKEDVHIDGNATDDENSDDKTDNGSVINQKRRNVKKQHKQTRTKIQEEFEIFTETLPGNNDKNALLDCLLKIERKIKEAFNERRRANSKKNLCSGDTEAEKTETDSPLDEEEARPEAEVETEAEQQAEPEETIDISESIGLACFGGDHIRQKLHGAAGKLNLRPLPKMFHTYIDLLKHYQTAYSNFNSSFINLAVRFGKAENSFASAPSETSMIDAESRIKIYCEMVSACLKRGKKFRNPEKINTHIESSQPTALTVKPDTVVRIRGLPWQCSDHDVGKFFAGLNIPRGGVSLQLTDTGRRSGEALVRFDSVEQRDMALKGDLF